jgi:pentatricopeptide repeat protein
MNPLRNVLNSKRVLTSCLFASNVKPMPLSTSPLMRFASMESKVSSNKNVTPSLVKLHTPMVHENAAIEELLIKRSKEKKKLTKEQDLIRKRLNKLEIIKAKRDHLRCWDQVSRLLDDMRIMGVEPTFAIYKQCISALVKAKRVDKAHVLIDRMRSEKIPITNELLCYMINACKFSVEPGKAQTYMNEFLENLENSKEELQNMSEEKKKIHSVVLQSSFTNLINVYARAEDLSGVHKTFALMKERGITLDTVSYGAVLKVYARLYRLDDALALVQEMKENNIPIDTIVYNMLIQSCKAPEEKDRAHELFNQMETENIPRDATTYGTIISKMMYCDDYEAVYSYYERFKTQTGIRATPFMFETLLKTCLRDGLSKPKREEAQLREDAKELGLKIFILPKSDINMRRVREYWTDMTHKYNYKASTKCIQLLNHILELRREHKKLFKEEYKAAAESILKHEKEELQHQLDEVKEKKSKKKGTSR